jgi:mono/diheme cytochrome c family protein
MQQHHSDIPPSFTDAPRPPKLGPIPFWMIALGLISVVGSWLPLVLFARAKAAVTTQPPVHFIQDMGIQPKYREQQSSEIFADGRADRPRILGTVARGQLEEDDHFYRGYAMATDEKTGKPAPKFFDDFPSQVKVDDKLMARGRERFNIYCSVCHGLDGLGNGPVNQRGLELQNDSHGTWVQAANLTVDPAKSRPAGHIFNTINVGIRNMPGYGAQVGPEDRWAIVAYVRALQLSKDVPSRLVPDDLKTKLKAAAK